MFKWVAIGYLEEKFKLECSIYRPEYSKYDADENKDDIALIKAGELFERDKVMSMDNVRVQESDADKLSISKVYMSPSVEQRSYKEMLEIINRFFDKSTCKKVDTSIIYELTDHIYYRIASGKQSELIGIIGGPGTIRDYLKSHSLHVGIINGLLGSWLEFDPGKIKELIVAGLLHDIGKIAIDQAIIDKPGKLTTSEYEKVKDHSLFGFEILNSAELSKPVNDRIKLAVLQHHERTNGTGYPYGTDFNTTGIYGKITAVADVFDAITSRRIYHEPESPFKVLNQYSKDCYSGFDINIVNVFLKGVTDGLVGQKVILSDLSCRQIVFIDELNYEFPIVQLNDSIVNTNHSLCVKHLV